ncbi:PIN-like domain superfamily [Sesbania bispinosa]|nr:PIN-like domain superfamily [Sesbania bispinosa]
MATMISVGKMKTLESTLFAGSSFLQPCFPSKCNPTPSLSCKSRKTPITLTVTTTNNTEPRKGKAVSGSLDQTLAQPLPEKKSRNKRVFFLDVNPLCYEGNKPSLHSFGRWLSLFLSQVTHNDPVIAVIDGERGSEHRRKLLPSYKAHRRKFMRHLSLQRFSSDHVGRNYQVINDVLGKCNVPVIKVDGHEADDVVATLAGQVLDKGFRVVIASPDKDFKQLVSEDVQIVMPLPELRRWSFYTLRHYRDQYNCDPQSDLSFRCIVGDEVDGVPGIQHLVPSFGRKTALKLIKKHGSLETLLNAAAVRTVGRPYAQDALKKYADYLRRNYEVLALKRYLPEVQINILPPLSCEPCPYLLSRHAALLCTIKRRQNQPKAWIALLDLKMKVAMGENCRTIEKEKVGIAICNQNAGNVEARGMTETEPSSGFM